MTNQERPPLKNISIMCRGSRGDLQPYLALAIALKSKGYNVRLLSSIEFKSFVEDFGIDFISLNDTPFSQHVKESQSVREWMATGSFMKFVKSVDPEQRKKDYQNIATAFWKEVNTNPPDLFIMGTLAFYFGYYLKYVHKIPVLHVALQPPLLYHPKRAPNGFLTLPCGLHYYLLLIFRRAMYTDFVLMDDIMESIGSNKRVTTLLPKSKYMKIAKAKTCSKMTLSETTLIAQPGIFKDMFVKESSEHLSFIGPLILDAKQQADTQSDVFGGSDTSKAIDDFINKDPTSPIVYCGWGSMMVISPEYMVRFAIKALQYSKMRGIVVGGMADLSLDVLQNTCDSDLISYAKQNVLFVKKVSHENVFPRMTCAIHHGGAGTFNAALRAGVPSIITPVIGDQYDQSYIINELGVGKGFPVHFHKINAENLGKAIDEVVNNSEMKARAKEVGEHIRQEDGNSVAVSKIEKFYAEYELNKD